MYIHVGVGISTPLRSCAFTCVSLILSVLCMFVFVNMSIKISRSTCDHATRLFYTPIRLLLVSTHPTIEPAYVYERGSISLCM